MNIFTHVILTVITLFIVFLFFPSITYACSCAKPPSVEEEQVSEGKAIFSGKVIKIEDQSHLNRSSANPVAVFFEVKKSWKNIDNSQVIVYTARDSASCGYQFTMNEEYLVYAYEHEGNLETTICSRTSPIVSAQEDFKVLGQGQMPTQQVDLEKSTEHSGQESQSDTLNVIFWLSVVGICMTVIILIGRRMR